MSYLSVKARRLQNGLSMIELMVAMVIGLFLMAAVLQVFIGSRVTYSMQSGLAKLQENGRFAIEYLSRDIRQLGFQGCSVNNTLANVVVGGAGVDPFIDLSNPLSGLNNVDGTANYDGISPIAGTDAILVKYAEAASRCTVNSHNPGAGEITCRAPHSFQQGDVLVVSDCSHSAVYRQSNINNNTSSTFHLTSLPSQNNCSQGLGAPVVCGASSNSHNFVPGSTVSKMLSARFFVALNEFGESSLYREGILISATAALGSQSVELVEGVADMQILYGVDTDSDNVPNMYVDGASAAAVLDDVSALRVSLLVQSNEQNLVQGTQSLQFNGAQQTFTDGRLRKVFSTTISLRNRL